MTSRLIIVPELSGCGRVAGGGGGGGDGGAGNGCALLDNPVTLVDLAEEWAM